MPSLADGICVPTADPQIGKSDEKVTLALLNLCDAFLPAAE